MSDVEGGTQHQVRITLGHLMSITGILQLVEILLAIIAAGCAGAAVCVKDGGICRDYTSIGDYTDSASGVGFNLFVLSISIILTSALFLLYLFNLRQVSALQKLPWRLIELVYLGGIMVLLFIAAAVEAWYADGYSIGYYKSYINFDVWKAAAVFMWFDLAVYIAHFVLNIIGRNG